jgi:hypothetical protein
MLVTRIAAAAGAAVIALALVAACAESTTPPSALECEREGETRCDKTGTLHTVCSKDPAGVLRFTTPAPCPGGARCENGKCLSACAPCTSPPPCFRQPGSCVGRECKYEPAADGASCDDGDPCTTGDSCSAGVCVGAPLECSSPPAPTCKDASTLASWSSPGSCSAGSCSYTANEVPCSLGCEGGACKGDPCKGVTCDKPPSACHRPTGSCQSGSCSYLADEGKPCDDKDACTSADKCTGSASCKGTPIACTTPPPNSCKDSATLVSYAKQGSCAAGKCGYTKSEVPCTHGCDAAAGACAGDPCAGVTCTKPPSAQCYKTPGSCSGGKCSYAFDDGKACSDSDPCTTGDKCVSGVCSGAPVFCNTPPKNSCKDASTLTVNIAPGSCVGGSCQYTSTPVACAFGCDAAAGACKGDPCATMVCDKPPNLLCYSVPGICSNGSCTYLPKVGASCDDGVACTRWDACNASGACAGTPYSCNDNLACTQDSCVANSCSFQPVAGWCLISVGGGGTPTCFQNGAYNNLNACQYCNTGKSQTAWTSSAGTAQVTWSFESGLQGFVITPSPATSAVKWQLDTKRADSAPTSLYFGNVAVHNFDDLDKTVAGEATSPAVALPASGKLCLEWRMFKDTESLASYDQLTVTALPAGTAIWRSQDQPKNATTAGAFASFIADVSTLAGQSVQFRFAFNSVDEIANSGEGVYLDTIRVLSGCSP